MLELGGFAFGLAFWAVLFWGSVRLVDGPNPHNKFSAAIAWSGLALIVSFVQRMMPLMGVVTIVAWLCFLLRLLTSFYNVSLLRSIGVLVAMGLGPYVVLPFIVRMIGDSELVATIVLFGFPIVTFGVWLTPWFRERKQRRDADPAIPVARVEKRSRKQRDATPGDAEAAPAIAPQPPVAPPPSRVAPSPPPAVVPPKVERPADAPGPDDGPTFLR